MRYALLTILLPVIFSCFAMAQISSSIPPIKYYSGYYVTDSSDTVRNIQLSFDERVFMQKGISSTFIIIKGKDGKPSQLRAYDASYFCVSDGKDTIHGRVVLVDKTLLFAKEIVSGPLKLVMIKYHFDYGKDAIRNAHARYCLVADGKAEVITPPLFRKDVLPFIKDCPQAATGLENGMYNYFKTEQLVRAYNDWYTLQHKPVSD